ncbi:MAG: hypothetical protein ACUVSY_07075 [Roseiflexus sp.]
MSFVAHHAGALDSLAHFWSADQAEERQIKRVWQQIIEVISNLP